MNLVSPAVGNRFDCSSKSSASSKKKTKDARVKSMTQCSPRGTNGVFAQDGSCLGNPTLDLGDLLEIELKQKRNGHNEEPPEMLAPAPPKKHSSTDGKTQTPNPIDITTFYKNILTNNSQSGFNLSTATAPTSNNSNKKKLKHKRPSRRNCRNHRQHYPKIVKANEDQSQEQIDKSIKKMESQLIKKMAELEESVCDFVESSPKNAADIDDAKRDLSHHFGSLCAKSPQITPSDLQQIIDSRSGFPNKGSPMDFSFTLEYLRSPLQLIIHSTMMILLSPVHTPAQALPVVPPPLHAHQTAAVRDLSPAKRVALAMSNVMTTTPPLVWFLLQF